MVGLLLVAAALLKVTGPPSAAHPFAGWVSAEWMRLAAVQYELFLGAWLLSGRHRRAGWAVAVGTFGLFAAVSFWAGWVGQASCGCFGAVPVRPWWAFGLDVVVLALLLFTRPSRFTSRDSIRSIADPTATFAVNVGLVLAVWSAAVYALFGSSDVAMARLAGKHVLLSPSAVQFGQVAIGSEGTATIEVRNLSTQPVRVVGGTSDCSCTLLDDLPADIPPGSIRSIPVRMRAPGEHGYFTRTVWLWTDAPGQQSVPLTLSGRGVGP